MQSCPWQLPPPSQGIQHSAQTELLAPYSQLSVFAYLAAHAIRTTWNELNNAPLPFSFFKCGNSIHPLGCHHMWLHPESPPDPSSWTRPCLPPTLVVLWPVTPEVTFLSPFHGLDTSYVNAPLGPQATFARNHVLPSLYLQLGKRQECTVCWRKEGRREGGTEGWNLLLVLGHGSIYSRQLPGHKQKDSSL